MLLNMCFVASSILFIFGVHASHVTLRSGQAADCCTCTRKIAILSFFVALSLYTHVGMWHALSQYPTCLYT